MIRVLRIDLKRLGKNREAAVEYMRSHVTETMTLKGDQLELDSTRVREAKTILHKFLHHARLEEYRVAVINSELIRVLEAEAKKQHPFEKTRGASPSTWETVPGQSWTRPSGLSRPGKRSKR